MDKSLDPLGEDYYCIRCTAGASRAFHVKRGDKSTDPPVRREYSIRSSHRAARGLWRMYRARAPSCGSRTLERPNRVEPARAESRCQFTLLPERFLDACLCLPEAGQVVGFADAQRPDVFGQPRSPRLPGCVETCHDHCWKLLENLGWKQGEQKHEANRSGPKRSGEGPPVSLEFYIHRLSQVRGDGMRCNVVRHREHAVLGAVQQQRTAVGPG